MRVSWIIVGSWLCWGCSSAPFVRTAYYGDLPTLKKQIAEAESSGRIDGSDVLDLARAVARREIRSSAGEDAIRRIRESVACAHSVEPELEEWARVENDAGGEAILVLVRAGLRDARTLVPSYSHVETGSLRAAAARGTSSTEHAELRRTYFADPDFRVRREAFRAAAEAMDAADLPQLLEAVRLDPDEETRALAAGAVGKLGGPEAVLGLVDLWPNASAVTQEAMVRAWAEPASFLAGGSQELLRVAERADSLASVMAAGALARSGAAFTAEGTGILARAIATGTDEERMLAIQLADLRDAPSLEALEKAAKDDDTPVRAVALARLLEVPAARGTALAGLRTLSAVADGAARQSRSALAVAGDTSVTELLRKQLAEPVATRRTRAALGLYRLGQAHLMAASLADPDPGVRMAVACGVLSRREPASPGGARNAI